VFDGIYGQYNSTIDEKGRLMIPARLRSVLPGDSLVVTRSVDKCLWAFPPEDWKSFHEKIRKNVSLLNSNSRIIMRRLLAPAQEINLDKAGRINIPPSLVKEASLSRECVIMGLGDQLEIWDAKVFEDYKTDTDPFLDQALEELDVRI